MNLHSAPDDAERRVVSYDTFVRLDVDLDTSETTLVFVNEAGQEVGVQVSSIVHEVLWRDSGGHPFTLPKGGLCVPSPDQLPQQPI